MARLRSGRKGTLPWPLQERSLGNLQVQGRDTVLGRLSVRKFMENYGQIGVSAQRAKDH